MSYTSRMFIAVWICMFLATFAISISSPAIPYLIKELVSVPDNPAKTEEFTSTGIGVMLSLNSIALVVGSLFGGFISDKVGRRKSVLLAFAVLALGFILFIISQSLMLLFTASFLEMLGYYLASPSFIALIADYTSHSSRGKGYGIFNLSWITAQIPAPILGGYLAELLGLKIPFYLSLIMAIATIPFSLMVPRQVHKEEILNENTNCTEDNDSLPPMPLRTVLTLFTMSYLISGLANGFVNALINSYVIFDLGASTAEFGLVSSLGFGLVTALAQIPGGKLADKFGRKPLVLSSGLIIPLIPVLAFTSNIWQFILVLAFICLIGNISSPAVNAWLMESVPSSRRASASGLTRMANGVGMAVGPILGSYSWSSIGSAASFSITGLIFSIQLIPYLKISETHAKRREVLK